jgi:hypothetical protein
MSRKQDTVRVRFVIHGLLVVPIVRKKERTKLGAIRPTGVSPVKSGAEKE